MGRLIAGRFRVWNPSHVGNSESSTSSDAAGTEPSKARRWPRSRWYLIGGIVASVVIAVSAVLFFFGDPEPTEFYSAPEDIPATPGTIIDSEPFEGRTPLGSEAWRIMYVTTDDDGDPIAATGLIIAPGDLPDGPAPVLVWAHGTTGIDTSCAPSLSGNPMLGTPDLGEALDEGWIIAMPDYVGLGTDDDHPYLIGDITARATLDSVRAVHDFDEDFDLTDDYAVWGHSQGGHAALFAGNHAEEYLPEKELAGVAALSPPTYLDHNLDTMESSEIGSIVQIYAVSAWSNYYPDVHTGILADEAQDSLSNVVSTCINSVSGLRIIVEVATLPDDVIEGDIAEDPDLVARAEENSVDPEAGRAPTFIGQGDDDELVFVDITENWVRDRCESAAPTTWIKYGMQDHVGTLDQGGDDALEWTIDRFAGEELASTCPSD